MGGCYAPLDRGGDREGCCVTGKLAPSGCAWHTPCPPHGWAERPQAVRGWREASWLLRRLRGGLQQDWGGPAEAGRRVGGVAEGLPVLGAAAGHHRRPRANLCSQRRGDGAVTTSWALLAAQAASSTSSHAGRGGPASNRPQGRVESPPPNPGGPRLCEASTPARDSRPRHAEAPNCRRETRAGPVSPQPKIDPLFTPIHRHIKAGFMGTGARRVSQPD